MNRIQAMELDGQIRKHLEEYSLQNGLNPTFGNTIMDKYLQIIPDTAKREMNFLGDKSASYKMGNIRLDIKSGLVAVAEFVASLSKTENVFQYTQLMIISVLCIVAISEKELDYDSAVVVYALHKQNAYSTGITSEQLKNEIERMIIDYQVEEFEMEKMDKYVSNLLKWKIIDIVEEKIYLKEIVWGKLKE